MKKKEDIILGKRIKDIRINLNYDQKRFAKEIGATVSALSNWENGRNKPNMEKLSNIAKIGDTSVKELLRSHLDKDEFEKRIRNRDTDLRGLIFEELVIFLNELEYNEFNYVVRESEKINKIVSLIIKSETDDKEEKLKDFVNELVDNLMSKTYILYWDLVYELCFSEDDIKREVYVSGMLFNFLMEYLQTDERYTLPLILFRLEETKKDIALLVLDLFSNFRYLLDDLNDFDLPRFKKYLLSDIDISELKNSLTFLTKILYQKYEKEVILLIDEYDNPLITAHKYDFYEEALSFFKVFYGEALKTNPYLKMGIMTGIIRVIKAGIFSDLNNLRVYSILNRQYSDFFGFTQNEVENALEDFNIEYELPDVKIWYDGYKFGNSEVYNPWSILNFLEDRELEAYWVGTSNNFLINDILKNTNSEINDSLEKLFNGEKIEEIITGNSDLSSLLSYHEIWELLLFSGYLTIDKKIDRKLYSLRIPNKEINELFKDEFIDVNFGESLFRNTMEALKKNKIDKSELPLMFSSTLSLEKSACKASIVSEVAFFEILLIK